MYNKLTRSQKEDRLLALQRLKDEIEFDNNPLNQHPESREELKKWRLFKALEPRQQQKIWDEWDSYYKEVTFSPAYQLFFELKFLLKSLGNEDKDVVREAFERIKELSQQARDMAKNNDLNTVKKPTSIDPWDFQRGWVKSYQDCELRIKEIQTDLNLGNTEEAQEVWR